MARSSFGQTWWGEQWLNALTDIDYDNRLPRGRSYANKGSVKYLVIDENAIHAKVQGSRPRPYAITITVPKITQKDSDRLLDDLVTNPAIIARLLNRELDPGVLERAQHLGIFVFPARWKDLDMQCSCPDWAVPCKHLAAVIYLLSREIDGNPFLVFSLRGINFDEGLKARHISLEQGAVTSLPTISDLLAAPENASPPVTPYEATEAMLSDFDQLDFSTLENLTEPLIHVLSENPSFFHGGNFRDIYHRVMTRIVKEARVALKVTSVNEEETALLHPDDRPHITLDGHYTATLSGFETIDQWPALLQAIPRMEVAHLPDYQPEVAALYYVHLAAVQLLAHGTIVPEIFSDEEETMRVRWLPAMLDASVRELIQRLADLLPHGMMTYKKGRSLTTLTPEQQAITLCSLFLDRKITHWGVAPTEKLTGNKTFDLFFSKRYASFAGPGERQISAGIQVWLSRFHLARGDYSPVVCLDESKTNHFALALAVEGHGKPFTLLSSVLKDEPWACVRFSILKNIMLLAEFFPPFNGYVGAGAMEPISIHSNDLPSFLFNTLPVIRLLGIRTLLPKGLDRLLRPRLSMKISAKSQSSTGFFKTDDLFNFNWQVALGDVLLTHAEFEALVNNATGIVRFRDEYVFLDPQEIARLRAQLEKPPVLSHMELLHTALAQEYAGAAVKLDDAAQVLMRTLTETKEVPLPEGLNADLRAYQLRGFAWLYRNTQMGFGSVIADDMGLGKTLQVVTMLLKLKEEGALNESGALVVVPTSLLTNWQKEIERFAPTLSVDIFHGVKRNLKEARPDVLLTTYGVVRSEATSLKKISWHVVVADEAQNIKNPAAAQTKAIKALPAKTFIAMSGTPVENRLSEYWSIMDFANRGYLNTLTHFGREFATPIQTHHDQHTIQRFRNITAPFLLRRLKSDKSIINDLPDKVEQNQFCELSTSQTALYESVLRESLHIISGESDAFKRQGLVLTMILALKQICNHPVNYLKEGQKEAELSGKGERFVDLLEGIYASQEKVLVFTQFREMGDLLTEWVRQRFGKAPLFLHGGVPRAKRDAMVERFQNDRTDRVFILSLKAGGTGLNLTAASNVIHYDLWWNPAVEAQATDRAYRIGQLRNVQVHRFITRATFEERINDMIQNKRELAELTVGTGEKWIGNLSNTELSELFSLNGKAP